MSDYSFTSNVILTVATTFVAAAICLCGLAIKSTFEENRKIKARLQCLPKTADKGSIFRNGGSLEQLADHVSLPDSNEISRIRFELSQAGFYRAGSVKIYYAARLFCLIIPQFAILFLWERLVQVADIKGAAIVSVIATIFGFYLPQLIIRRRQNKRRAQIKNGFPDMMDLLVACIEAGLSLNAAFARVGVEIGKRYPVLKLNLDLLNMELRAGRERHVGMKNFANRVDLPEAKSLAVMLRQSEEMGSSVGVALRTFSEDMRSKRMLKAEEKAMALSAKLTVPLIIFIFPAIMVTLLLPAGVRLARALGT